MFRRTLIQAAAALACAAAIPSAFAFAEGTDYVALSAPLPGGEGKLVKVWSYDCPFCFKYDAGVDPKMVPAMEKATGLKFDMFHLETKGKYGRAGSELFAYCLVGKYGRAGSELFAYCLVKDKAAGITNLEDPKSLFKKAKDAIYKAYHKKGERWTAGEDAFLKTGLDAAGISADEFAKNRKNADVQAVADSWKASYDVGKIQGIPAYVVNGKYLIMTKSIRSVNGMVELIGELAKK